MKTEKRTMTLNMTNDEMKILERLASDKGLSKTALVRQALRVYQSVMEKVDKGDKLFFKNHDQPNRTRLIII